MPGPVEPAFPAGRYPTSGLNSFSKVVNLVGFSPFGSTMIPTKHCHNNQVSRALYVQAGLVIQLHGTTYRKWGYNSIEAEDWEVATRGEEMSKLESLLLDSRQTPRRKEALQTHPQASSRSNLQNVLRKDTGGW